MSSSIFKQLLIDGQGNILQKKYNNLFFTFSLQSKPQPPVQMATSADIDYKTASSIYDFTVKDTYLKDVSLEKYRGNVVLIVNVASQCGLTKNNYAKLTKLNKDYHDKGNLK